MDESVDAYVPSKAIPQTVLMEMYGGSSISRFPRSEFVLLRNQVRPASNSEWIEVTRLVLAPAYPEMVL